MLMIQQLVNGEEEAEMENKNTSVKFRGCLSRSLADATKDIIKLLVSSLALQAYKKK